jgi:hypothetical protein
MRTTTTTRPLRELVLDFHTGKIQLPQFQRDYVWRPSKIRNLLDSLLRAFPIGGFYFWRPTSATLDPKPKGFGEIRIGNEFIGYLIDGQQRLTSLEAAFGLYSGADKRGDELRCYLDLTANDDDRGRDTRLFVSYRGASFDCETCRTGRRDPDSRFRIPERSQSRCPRRNKESAEAQAGVEREKDRCCYAAVRSLSADARSAGPMHDCLRCCRP